MTYTRRFAAALLIAMFVLAGVAGFAPAAEAGYCVGADVTVTVLGQPYPVLTNGCSWCFISQGPNWVGTGLDEPHEKSVRTFFCLDPP